MFSFRLLAVVAAVLFSGVFANAAEAGLGGRIRAARANGQRPVLKAVAKVASVPKRIVQRVRDNRQAVRSVRRGRRCGAVVSSGCSAPARTSAGCSDGGCSVPASSPSSCSAGQCPVSPSAAAFNAATSLEISTCYTDANGNKVCPQ